MLAPVPTCLEKPSAFALCIVTFSNADGLGIFITRLRFRDERLLLCNGLQAEHFDGGFLSTKAKTVDHCCSFSLNNYSAQILKLMLRFQRHAIYLAETLYVPVRD
jgi:hypothetical protein